MSDGDDSTDRSQATLSEFSALVLEKLQSIDKNSHDMIRLRRNLQFCPLLSDIQKYRDKSFFLDSLVIHALELDTKPITGNQLIIAITVQNRVLKDCGLNLQNATLLLKAHFEGPDALLRRDDISADKSQIFNYRLHGRVLAWFRRSHQEMNEQFSKFWQYLENPKNIKALHEMNKNASKKHGTAQKEGRSRKESLRKYESCKTAGQNGAKEEAHRCKAK